MIIKWCSTETTMGCKQWYTLLATGLSLLCFAASQGPSGVQCPDEYMYTEQPPAESVCNPYIRGILELDCAIVGSDILDIRWFYAKTLNMANATQLQNSSKYTLTPHANNGITGVRLTVSDLNEAQDQGYYWCQGVVTDGSLTMSEIFWLFMENLYFPSECDDVLRRSMPTCAEVERTDPPTTNPTTLPPTTQVTTLPPSPGPHTITPVTSSPLPKSTPSLSSEETSSIATTTSTVGPVTPGVHGSSQLILYVVLGMVGFLGIICIALGVIIVVLCKNRCRGANISGVENKGIGFDHLSNQSDFALISTHKLPSPPQSLYQPESTQPSGHRTQQRDLSGDYAEIGPALIMNSDRLNHLHASFSGTGTNPPPLPHPHPRFTGFHSSLEVEPHSISNYENPYDLPVLPPIGSGGTDGASSQAYHVLERTYPPMSSRHDVNSGLFSETSSFSTPPDSPPHNYQSLEDSSAQAIPSPPTPVHVHTGQSLFAQPTIDFSQEHRVSARLETIPEHPYHVLEKNAVQSTAQSLSAGESASSQALPPSTETADSTDDQEYDRLVSPPHLYHILEHSPSLNKPRIHRFQFTNYNHLEPAPARKEPLHSPQSAQLHTLTESLSSESDSDVFDDPQYQLSPLPDRRTSHKQTGPHSCSHGRPPVFAHPSVLKVQEAVDLTKYSGDYERDPTYMQRLQSTSPKLLLASPTVQLVRNSDVTGSQDDSGFCMYSARQSSELKRQSSLPDLDLPHVYQALQANTMDPLLPYEKVQKTGSQSSGAAST